MSAPRDHGGGIDAAVARWGETRADWIDLSTGINPSPYPLPDLAPEAWTALPDAKAADALVDAAHAFWKVPDGGAVLAAPGASSAIAQLPRLVKTGGVDIPGPTYNEHAAAFRAAGWADGTDARVIVHPNNPDGRLWAEDEATAGNPRLLIIDESFCDIAPDQSLIHLATRPGTVILKSFGKFWGLAGLRLGFVIGDPALVAGLAEALGPWPVSGPALEIGRAALGDLNWADATRVRLAEDAARLDHLVGAPIVGGTPLFRLYDVGNAAEVQDRLGKAHILSRIFPYSDTWLRLGLPAPDAWPRLEEALA